MDYYILKVSLVMLNNVMLELEDGVINIENEKSANKIKKLNLINIF